MKVRKLDANYDMVFGHSSADFWQDVPDAPAQCVLTRLELYLGEWFLNTADGTPWYSQILSGSVKNTAATRDPALQARMLGTQGINSMLAYASQLDRNTRTFTVQATLDTIYGQISLIAPLIFPPVLPPSPPTRTLVTQSGKPITTQTGQEIQAQT